MIEFSEMAEHCSKKWLSNTERMVEFIVAIKMTEFSKMAGAL
jgi:hypothetical protein